jgi:hypothetical protein
MVRTDAAYFLRARLPLLNDLERVAQAEIVQRQATIQLPGGWLRIDAKHRDNMLDITLERRKIVRVVVIPSETATCETIAHALATQFSELRKMEGTQYL